jgi:PEGA domain
MVITQFLRFTLAFLTTTIFLANATPSLAQNNAENQPKTEEDSGAVVAPDDTDLFAELPKISAENIDPCEIVSCSGHGNCLIKNGEPMCACSKGYGADSTGLGCVPFVRKRLRKKTQPLKKVRNQYRLNVVTDAPGTNVSIDNKGGWYLSPVTLLVPPGQHRLVLTKRGYEDLVYGIQVVDKDLTIEVEMNRPVFAAGVALTTIGVIGIVGGAVLLSIEGTDGLALPLSSGAVLATGIGMMIGDKVDDTTPRITEAAH